MAQTAFDICSRALARCGIAAIASFTAGTAESDVAGREYEQVVREKLGAHRWRFAMELKSLGVKLADTPATKWDYAYQIPADCLVIHGCYRNDLRIDFGVYGDKLFCDEDADVVLEYVFRQTEASFPPYFSEALVMELAGLFAAALNRDTALAQNYLGEARQVLWPRARLLDSQSQTAPALSGQRIVAVRR